MPPTKSRHFFKYKKKGSGTSDVKQNSTQQASSQSTLSKFFSFNSKRRNDVSADDESQQSSLIKRQRTIGDEGCTTIISQEGSSEDATHSKMNDECIGRIRERLQNFAAVPDTEPEDSSESAACNFDYHILRREQAKNLPDINLIENSAKRLEHKNNEEADPLKTKTDGETKADSLTEVPLSEPSHLVEGDGASFDDSSHVKLFKKFSKTDKPTGTSRTSKPSSSGSGKVKYTQLEQQFLDIKDKYQDAVLLVECGYKYRFFGEDAEIAAQVLKIYAHLDHSFMTASIPVHRLFVHVRRLVAAGYKVGVVKQTETAALKAAGANRSAPFSRELTALYTKSTFVDDTVGSLSEDVPSDYVATETNYLLCVCDNIQDKASKKTTLGIVAVQPSTGDVIYDSFEDSNSRSELETRLLHIQPVEIIMSKNVTPPTARLIESLISISHRGDDRLRLEKTDQSHYEYSTAFKHVTDFYTQTTSSAGSSNLEEVLNLPQPVLGCLSALMSYLQDFKLDKILADLSTFSRFTSRAQYMQLGANTLRNLEVFNNCTDGKETGSLYWALNYTVTKPGARLLKKWISKPLMNKGSILARQEAVQELLDGVLSQGIRLRGIMGKLPDLEKALTAVYHKKCSPGDFFTMSKALESVHREFQAQKEALGDQVTSPLLREIIIQIVELLSDISDIAEGLNEDAAKESDKTKLFRNEEAFPDIVKCKREIATVLEQLKEHRRHVRLTVRQPSLEYTTVLGTEFLVEVRNANLNFVPKDWTKISSTKALSRFHSPLIAEKYKLLQQLREQLTIDSDRAWLQFLDEFVSHYQRYRRAVSYLSQLDCLLSLTSIAQQEGYCRPEIQKDGACIEIEAGRHPVVQQLLGNSQQYVANNTQLNGKGKRVMIITGPNMGGKSCYIRQVAVLSLMAQIGSYIPASRARLGLLDAIYTRMGAADEIYKGRSTFMVELQEAAEIMSKVTSRSLVILDELGRGTSTHDGVAIAHATLDFFIREPKCLTLFVTHHTALCELAQKFEDHVSNYHMAFMLHDAMETDEDTSEDRITFLYQLVSGSADRSYGLNVARLADLPQSICAMARHKSIEMEDKLNLHRNSRELFLQLFKDTGMDYRSVLTISTDNISS